MGFHGLIRATEDLDIFIRATEENVARLKRAFRAAYENDPNIDDIRAADLLGDYPAVRYYPPSGDLYFDVMTRLGEVASFETVAAETKKVEGIDVPVTTPLALYRLKPGTVRAVQRFRTIEEMAAAPVAVLERFARHCARYWAIAPRVYPRGVYRFRSIAEAQAARERLAMDRR
jgi:hypothetical protein